MNKTRQQDLLKELQDAIIYEDIQFILNAEEIIYFPIKIDYDLYSDDIIDISFSLAETYLDSEIFDSFLSFLLMYIVNESFISGYESNKKIFIKVNKYLPRKKVLDNYDKIKELEEFFRIKNPRCKKHKSIKK